MEKEITPYEQALALKELGFNRRTFAQYNTHQGNEWILTFDLSGEGQYPNNSSACVAPLYQQAFRWFREKYKLFATICHDHRNINDVTPYFYMIDDCPSLNYKVYRTQEDVYIQKTLVYKTYEEAELECLKKLIEIVKNK